MKIQTLLLTLVSAIFFCSSAWADKYVIQVGAFHKVTAQTLSTVAHYGDYQQEQSGNLTRLTVGLFQSRQDAEKRLVDVKKDYPEAFVRMVEGQKNKEHHHSYEQLSDHHHPHFSGPEMEKWQHLTEDQRAHAVYLDGKLHLKYGDDFTSIDAVQMDSKSAE